MAGYQDELRRRGFGGLGIHAAVHPQAESNGRFVGSKACEECHKKSYKTWQKTAHAAAYATLANLDPPRNFDPECISCHVVGWHPTKCFPYQSGYESAKATPQLENVGCEDCHGPGEKHVAAEQGTDAALQKKMQQAMVITKTQATDPHSSKECQSCHDGDNSPAFDFKKYWPLIEHHD
jgi:nitrate/TMAO reductase-like tetraheme cytochrome c subunit